jgi:cytoskeleton protein RodZ
MLTVGNLLKKAREHSGKQIEEIAQIIRIKPDYLRKIEQNDFTDFNSSTFVKGFIRSYSSFLGLDAENIVALFRRQIGEEDVPLKAKKTISQQHGIVISPMTIVSVAIVLLFIGLFGFLLTQFYRLQQPPALTIVQPIESILTVNTNSYEIKGLTEENALISVNGTQLQLRDDHTFSLLVQLKQGDNSFTFDAWKKTVEGKHATKIVTIIYEPGSGTATITPSVSGATGSTVSVSFSLSDSAWIQIVADNTQKAVGIKNRGYKLDFTATKMIEITTGKPNISMVTLDGKLTPWKIKNGVGSLVCENSASGWKCKD